MEHMGKPSTLGPCLSFPVVSIEKKRGQENIAVLVTTSGSCFCVPGDKTTPGMSNRVLEWHIAMLCLLVLASSPLFLW